MTDQTNPRLPDEDEDIGPSPLSPDAAAAAVAAAAMSSAASNEDERRQWDEVRSGQRISAPAPFPSGPIEREAWMLAPPEAGRARLDFDLMQRNVTTFSRKGTVSSSGPDASWTATPKQPGESDASNEPAPGAKKMTLEEARERARSRAQGIAPVVQAEPQPSLLELHLQNQGQKDKKKDKKDKKKKKKRRSRSSSDSSSSSSSSSSRHKHHKKKKSKKRKRDDHKDRKSKRSKKSSVAPSEPYWDRDRDLIGSSSMDPAKRAKMLADASKLNSRFSSAGYARSFI